jgi:DNA modification methylase
MNDTRLVEGSVSYIRSNANNLPIANDSVDLIITSPPYFALRSYQDGGEHYDGQLGDEPSVHRFIDSLLECTSEMMRVIKPTGSIFVNLGDKYANHSHRETSTPKSLMGIPWRYAIRCHDELGLAIRAEIIWHKPNAVPESVRDRVARRHEHWFHFTKTEKYFSAIDEIREPHKTTQSDTARRGPSGMNRSTSVGRRHDDGRSVGNFAHSALGRLPGSVWTINTRPLRIPDDLGISHYAAFPTSLPALIIRGWSPIGLCTRCLSPRSPIVERHTTGRDNNRAAQELGRSIVGSRIDSVTWTKMKEANPDRIIGYGCECPSADAPTTRAIVLDPFGGTGTTAAVAKALGRDAITNDLSHDYLRLARWRCDGDGYRTIWREVHGEDIRRDTTNESMLTLFDVAGDRIVR